MSHRKNASKAMVIFGSGILGNILYAGTIIYELTEKIIYFDVKELFHLVEKGIFEDAGGFDGKTTKQFLDWGGESDYSYYLNWMKRVLKKY